MAKRLLFFASLVLLIAACTTSKTPTAPTSAPSAVSGALAHVGHGATVAGTASAENPNSAAHDDKGYIDGWFNGEDVQLYYTKSFFCDPLSPTTPVPCELGAPPDTAPRPGPIPTIYAIAAAPTIANLVNPDNSRLPRWHTVSQSPVDDRSVAYRRQFNCGTRGTQSHPDLARGWLVPYGEHPRVLACRLERDRCGQDIGQSA